METGSNLTASATIKFNDLKKKNNSRFGRPVTVGSFDLSSKSSIVVQASTERRVRRSLFALLVLTTTADAQVVIFTYDQWERLSIGLQEIYLAGAIDSLSTITTPPAAATSKYYNDCLVKKQITAHIIAEEMKAIVKTRPDLIPKPATGALLQSLIKLCGLPVPDWPSPSQ